MNTLHMGERTNINKGFGGILRRVGSLPCAAAPHNWGRSPKDLLCGVANFLGGVGWVFIVADTHLRHIAVALRQRVELF